VHRLIFNHSSVFRLPCFLLLSATHLSPLVFSPVFFFAAAIFLYSGLEWGRNNQQFPTKSHRRQTARVLFTCPVEFPLSSMVPPARKNKQ
jgi:hypothetical protein